MLAASSQPAYVLSWFQVEQRLEKFQVVAISSLSLRSSEQPGTRRGVHPQGSSLPRGGFPFLEIEEIKEKRSKDIRDSWMILDDGFVMFCCWRDSHGPVLCLKIIGASSKMTKLVAL